MLARLVPLALVLPLVLVPSAGGAPVTIDTSGVAGEWLVYYQPFLAPTTGVGFSVVIDAATSSDIGTPVSLFVMPPMIVYDRGGSDRGMFDVFKTPSVTTQAIGGPLERHETLGASVGSSGMVGVVFAMAASHAWTLHLELDVASGSGLGAPVLLRGDGALFASAAPIATPVGGRSEISFELPTSGWTHLSADALHLQPVGVRSYDVRFPNGFRFAGTGTMVGANAVAVGLASSNNYWGGFGATADTAGTLTASVTYAEATPGVNLGAVHLPDAALPAALTALNYKTFDGGLDIGLPPITI